MKIIKKGRLPVFKCPHCDAIFKIKRDEVFQIKNSDKNFLPCRYCGILISFVDITEVLCNEDEDY